MLVIEQLMVPIDFHSIYFPAMEVNGDQPRGFGSSKYVICVQRTRNKLIQVWNKIRMSKL